MKLGVSRWILVLIACAYLAIWSASLVVALLADPREALGPSGHGTLEAAYMTLVGISAPLGLLAFQILATFEPSGRLGIVFAWCGAGFLGAIQWLAILAVARAIWEHYRPPSAGLSVK
jgi:hypothetical protein